MFRVPTLRLSFLLIFFFIICALYFNYGEQRPRTALAMAKKNPHVPWMYPPRHHGKSYQPMSLWYWTNHTPAKSNKKSNPDNRTGAEKENQINKWGGINRKTIAVDSRQKKQPPPTKLNKRNWRVSGIPGKTDRNQKKNHRSAFPRGTPSRIKAFSFEMHYSVPKGLTSATEALQYDDGA